MQNFDKFFRNRFLRVDRLNVDIADYVVFNKDKLILPHNVFNRMLAYAEVTKSEISGFGKVEKKGKDFVVTEIRIFPQECSGAFTELKQDDLIRFLSDIIARGENPEDWKLWWHSHYNFDQFFSTTDTNTIAQLTESSQLYPKGSRLFSLCINNKGNMVARKDNGSEMEEMDIVIEPDYNSALYKAVTEEVKQKVKIKKFVSIKTFKQEATPKFQREEIGGQRILTATIEE